MTNPGRMMLAGVLAIGGFSLLTSSAKAQQAGPRPIAATPVYRANPATYTGRRVNPVYTNARSPRMTYGYPVLPHARDHRDWTTGNENLPLAKPWLHSFR